MKMKTSELQGAALDWAVALIEYPEWKAQGYLEVFPHDLSFDDGETYAPSTDWSQGGPIIEREGLGLWYSANAVDENGTFLRDASWYCETAGGTFAVGPTPLIAAMRCFVASKLGDEVTIPEEVK